MNDKIRQQLVNHNTRRFRTFPSHNYNLTIVIPVTKMTSITSEHYEYLRQNGLEILFLVSENIKSEKTISQLKTIPFVNWMVFSCSAHISLLSVIHFIFYNSYKKNILFLSDITSLPFITSVLLNDLILKIRFYKRHVITYFDENIKGIAIDKLHCQALFNFDCVDRYFEDKSLDRLVRLFNLSGLGIFNSNKISVGALRDYPGFYKENENKLFKPYRFNVLYDYKNNKYAINQLREYLKEFISYEIFSSLQSDNYYNKIVLVQSYNESKNMNAFLENMGKHFDGIILLDDSSEDGTYSMASHKKLLLKVQKRREEFNDLQNRNILLNLASFFPSKWLCFMDVDERIDDRFCDFSVIENDDRIDTLAFNIVHLWNEEGRYNSSYPNSYAGMVKTFRMFRNIGYCQIHTHKKYHFHAVPYFENECNNCPILVLHYGFLEEKNRILKYNFYRSNDPLAKSGQYEYLISASNILKSTENIQMNDLLDIRESILV